ncbi:hypothetical protein ACROYT_G010793 [Oculina patagonica]
MVMMMMKSLLVLLAAVLIVTEAKQPPLNRQECSKLIRGTTCNEDSECACLGHHNSSLICNYRWKCMERTLWDYITRKLPCHRIYKSACMEDADCPCREAALTCENNECVRVKFVVA